MLKTSKILLLHRLPALAIPNTTKELSAPQHPSELPPNGVGGCHSQSER
jgi:hypothetical protein